MAFEDRSSPYAATSPSHGDCNDESSKIPNSPESTRTSPFSCMTIPEVKTEISYTPSPQSSPVMPSYLQPKSESFFRITSYALSSQAYPQKITPTSHPFTYHSQKYLQERLAESPASTDRASSPNESVQSFNPSEVSLSSPPPSRNEPPQPEPMIQTLKYSIRNILQPEFGKSAVLKKKTPSNKISFRPYDNVEEKKSQAPLGSLCETVSQIGRAKSPEPRAKSPVKLNEGAEESKGEDGKVPQLWPAWVYCTRYSDRPSSGKFLNI